MKVFIYLVLVLVGLVVFMVVWSAAGGLVSQPNSIAVVVGVFLYVLMLAAVFTVIYLLVKMIKWRLAASKTGNHEVVEFKDKEVK